MIHGLPLARKRTTILLSISMCSNIYIYSWCIVDLLSQMLKSKGHPYTEAKELILLSPWLEIHHIKPHLEFNIPLSLTAPFTAKGIEKLEAIKSISMAHFFENTASLINEK